ncbi:Serine/threonine-protein kinase-like protein [Emericellopsis cladophorae]|uniref:non-specific serine/threonine protein kinase n=1 Tax=Emericellopsis cladophorae TaxID=2686198 RepID=A0A9P9XTV5_9HYPO|nr:Serine/threonine-protein kinase-like protein [Emericellopsis cladophorae]KAI6777670.1 Serine/threonine-protein kinase-like protein [Emericellopsis cladophorae]
MPIAPGPAAPAGTFQPGTKIQVGGHRVVIQKYLSEGGFAHVYLVKLPKPVDGTDLAVLKRVAVPDKENLRSMRTEVETMKRLKGHRMIVSYIDSHASELKGGGYEVFLLMEYCGGGGLIDFMNTRLQHRLTEPEILNIFCDVAEGVACMHYLKPPLLHRDLKIENVLITTTKGSSKRFKLCDFGSSAPPSPAPTSVVECRLMDEDVQKHTTLQYRSPEMVDVYRKQPLNEKSDIWALGVFLYKLCYYTTPFEDQGQLAILNASYKFPPAPAFSHKLKGLIASMLRENLQSRPNIYQVLKEACALQGREVPIHDIYAGGKQSSAQAPAKAPSMENKPVGAVFSPPVEEKPKIPEVTPMRRGRPIPSPGPAAASQPSKPPQPASGDPFAALDTKSPRTTRPGEPDEFASRFPSLDQFSLLHDSGSKHDFDSGASAAASKRDHLNQRVSEHLADEVFASSRSPPQPSAPSSRPQSVVQASVAPRAVSQHGEAMSRSASAQAQQDISRAQSIIRSDPDLQAISGQASSRYVSIGTSTSDLQYEPPVRTAHRVAQIQASESPRSSSLPTRQASPANVTAQPPPDANMNVLSRVTSLQSQSSQGRSSPVSQATTEPKRPQADLLDITPTNVPNVERSRPQSMNFETTTLDYLREREASRPQSRMSGRPSSQAVSPIPPPADDDNQPESDNLEFLRSMEGSGSDMEKSKNAKRSSVQSLSGGRNMLATKFGDAFKRFEGSPSSSARTPSPFKEHDRRDLTPIAGSEVTDDRSEDGHSRDVDAMTPEARRELERRKLEEEEQRVEAAQAEYRKRVTPSAAPSATASQSGPRNAGPPPRAMSIQNRVQNLLQEQKSGSVRKTAEGYGKYSDAAAKVEKPLPEVPRKPMASSKPAAAVSAPHAASHHSGTWSAPPSLPPSKPKPAAPRKPMHLNSIPTGNLPSPAATPQASATATEQLVAVDLPGQPLLDMSADQKDDYLRDFSQRYPSLSALDGAQSTGAGR